MSPHRPRKRFGQHFLRDPGVIDAIVRAIRPADSDTIVEIGPGEGAITQSLAASAGALHLIELDRDLAAQLRRNFAERAHVTVHEADALQFDYSTIQGPLRVVGNLPYNISTPLLFHLLQYRNCISDMHFMLQKEVVERLAASPGTKAWGRLSVMTQARADVTMLFRVPPGAFTPAPKVESAIVRIVPRALSARQRALLPSLEKVVRAAFAQRRKTLKNTLKGVIGEDEFEALNIEPIRRAETLSLDEFGRMADWVQQRKHRE